jgi:hypothetical protein
MGGIEMIEKTIVEKFEEKYIPEPNSGCWLWLGFNHGKRRKCVYGGFHYNGKIWLAHRVSYVLYKGPIPNGKHILHVCDNPKCVNPDHLYAGTQQNNMDDMRIRFREPNRKGEAHSWTKLTEKDVLYIRAHSEFSLRKLSNKFHVTPEQISNVRRRKNWIHI